MHNAEILLSTDYRGFYAGFSSVPKRIEMATLTISSHEGLISTLQPHKYDYIYEALYDDCKTLFRIYNMGI